VGFVVAVLALGAVLDHTGLDYAPAGIALFWLGMAVAAFLVHDAPAPRQKHTDDASLLSVLKQPTLLALLLACFCSQASFTPYYNFFTLFLEQHGHSRSVAGVLWALGVVAEVALFAVMAKVMLKVGTRRLMEWALLITALRWFLTAWLADSLLGLVLLQLSHALSFGAYHACAMHYVQSHFPSHLQGRGQAIYNAVAYGVGGSVGSLVVGYLWTAWSPEATFVLAGIVAAVGFLVFRQTFRKHAHPI
jgi:PPP family 3-phenylpropionic acid transporter